MFKSTFARACAAGAIVIGLATSVSAFHPWGNYHWARTDANTPVVLTVASNLTTTAWRTALGSESVTGSVMYDWDASSVLELNLVTGAANRSCKPKAGRIEVCNSKYGNNGWLGIAQIWITGNVHITQAVTKVNDTYFNTPTYNTAAWRKFVMCQEVGHDFGLGHQDEDFDNANMNSCMDYTSDPTTNLHPNQHDYDQLQETYAHADGFTTASASQLPAKMPPAMGQIDFETPGQWGRVVGASRNGRQAVYELDFGGGNKVVTHVFWADPDNDHQH